MRDKEKPLNTWKMIKPGITHYVMPQRDGIDTGGSRPAVSLTGNIQCLRHKSFSSLAYQNTPEIKSSMFTTLLDLHCSKALLYSVVSGTEVPRAQGDE